MTRASLILLAGLLLAACGGPDDLSVDAVQSIPDGDGTGAALAGDYAVDVRVVECRGACGPFSVGIFSASLCDVGEVDSAYLTAHHADGHLAIDTDDLPSRFEGGAYHDGSFDVGGYATQLGGELQITARALGIVDAAGRFEATVRSRSWGSIEGQSVDCVGVREVVGVRE